MDEYPIIKPLMTKAEVAAFLRISPDTVDKLKTKGKLKPVPNIGINLYKGSDVLRLIRMTADEANIRFDVRNLIEENERLRKKVEYYEGILADAADALKGLFRTRRKDDA